MTDQTRDDQLSQTLRSYWGFDHLRPLQREVVDASLNNRDAVVVMPTGGGKSLCFQLPAAMTGRLTVVVSPLIALMKDQVDGLSIVGVPAAALNSTVSAEEENEVRRKTANGELRLLYVSPERLLLSSTLQLLANADQGKGVARFAIDEAHCISAWGHDFRPEFRRLNRIREVFPTVPVQAFTATATPQVQRDIAIQLKLERPRRFVGIFDRPNLTYRIVAKDDTLKRIVEAVQRYPDEGVIVYCLSRKDTETIANGLVAKGIPAVAYHAGLANEVRHKVSEDFAQERVNVVVATIAFGMGIDRSNVRCVIHECLPKSMEGYQQETGRAGRDGLPSECVLLYSHGDVVRLKRLLSEGEPERVAHNAKLLEEVRKFVTSHQCRHQSLSEHFGQTYEVPEGGCGACDVCLGGTQLVPNGDAMARQILSTASDLARSGRGFGVGFLASILSGSHSKQVIERQGEKAEGFGALRGEASERIVFWVHQLADRDLLSISEGQYPLVSVTAAGGSCLDSSEAIELIENVALVPRASGGAESTIPDADPTLYEELRKWRRAKAAERAVPAYVIFHDATLGRLAAIRPSTKSNLRQVSGVGERRAEEFGEELLQIIFKANLAVDQTNLSTQEAEPRRISEPKKVPYWDYFRQGKSIEFIAEATSFKASTIWQHLANWVDADQPGSIDVWVSPKTQLNVLKAIGQAGGEQLKPIFELLDGQVPYEEIRVVRAFWKSSQVG